MTEKETSLTLKQKARENSEQTWVNKKSEIVKEIDIRN